MQYFGATDVTFAQTVVKGKRLNPLEDDQHCATNARERRAVCATRNRDDLISRPVRFIIITVPRDVWYFGAPDVTFAQTVVKRRLLVISLEDNQHDASDAKAEGN